MNFDVNVISLLQKRHRLNSENAIGIVNLMEKADQWPPPEYLPDECMPSPT
ncbi:hypothetical protein [Parvibaculum lavamentivorans]|uniref:hypothetical protein n=1 Tax=Parvibaculum lavamentivorans TaxID=256618 RepID=UPI0019309FAF|nr:hypothetical protein [Parvibaculum lavamentivorans]